MASNYGYLVCYEHSHFYGRLMLTLYLVRHARAMAIAPSDKERELTPQGCSDAAKLGGLFQEQLTVPEAILCSSATRTIQTHQIMQKAGLSGDGVCFDDGLYNASASFFCDAIASCEVQSLAVIGHNPALAIALNQLAPADDVAPDLIHFPTATIAHITFELDDFKSVTPHSQGTLHALIRGSAL